MSNIGTTRTVLRMRQHGSHSRANVHHGPLWTDGKAARAAEERAEHLDNERTQLQQLWNLRTIHAKVDAHVTHMYANTVNGQHNARRCR